MPAPEGERLRSITTFNQLVKYLRDDLDWPIESDEFDDATRQAVMAFQRHFRPARVDGIADRSTAETLRQLTAERGPR